MVSRERRVRLSSPMPPFAMPIIRFHFVSFESLSSRKHVLSDVPLKMLHSPKVFLARRTTGFHDLVLRVHERVQIVAQYFFPKSF
jgi:hypothetical protein